LNFSYLKMYARFAAELPSFLCNPITLADAEAMVRRGMEERESNFLRLVERGVLSRPQSPYARLMRVARCEPGDLKALVESRGLEHTLGTLREAGVYITFEEFKGREPVVRHGESFAVTPADFDNPYLRKSYEAQTSGSTGAGTRVAHDLDHLAAQSAHFMLLCHAHDILDAPMVIWRGVLPDGDGMHNVLRSCRHGRVPVKWFGSALRGDPKPELRFRLANFGMVAIARMVGVAVPWPENVAIEDAAVVARYIAGQIRQHKRCLVSLAVSRALRVSIAAQKEGLDLSGTAFMIAGEPPTPAKVAGIRASGASCFPTYGFAEGGRIAMGCANPMGDNDLHVLRDAFEVLPFERMVPGSDLRVKALNVTSLLLSTPKILLNTEIDDFGVVEKRSCGCPLERLGYDLHVRDIHSFRKLTGEGMTLVGSEMIDILERVLPAKFGGSALDYQLMEEEDASGFTRLILLMGANTRPAEEAEMRQVILDSLAGSSMMADGVRKIWRQTGTIQVRRGEPRLNGRGKLMPLFLSRRPEKAEGQEAR